MAQNSRLVTNFAGEDELMSNLAFLATVDQSPRLDLFYGEPSYLGIVIFVCVVCYMQTSRLIADVRHNDASSSIRSSSSKTSFSGTYHRYVVVVAIVSMLYLQSLSSIMYALLVLLFEFGAPIFKRASTPKLLSFIVLLVFLALFFRQSLEYSIYRVTMQDSLSVFQRFGPLLDFDVSDYLFGVSEETKVPDIGFHNGLLYIIAISGLAGIAYVSVILRAVYRSARQIKMSALSVLVIMALIMQNGAVFSPNKVVLFALILLPLSCARAVYLRSNFNSSKGLRR
ncbi:MAG: hypothetical protein HYZ31_01235 [Gammaproteobacteria bacterium]|nr:hypothetical protein [Gammaproteobacteria bacterium]